MFGRILLIAACALSLGIAPVLAQDAPPPPPGPSLFIPAPEGFEPPSPEEGHEAFEEAFFAAVAGDDGVLTLEELKAIMPPPEEMPKPPEEGEEPPEEGEEPPPLPPGVMIPLPEGFEPPPPEEGPEAFLEAAFAAVAGDDGELTLEEFMEALPEPEPPEE